MIVPCLLYVYVHIPVLNCQRLLCICSKVTELERKLKIKWIYTCCLVFLLPTIQYHRSQFHFQMNFVYSVLLIGKENILTIIVHLKIINILNLLVPFNMESHLLTGSSWSAFLLTNIIYISLYADNDKSDVPIICHLFCPSEQKRFLSMFFPHVLVYHALL